MGIMSTYGTLMFLDILFAYLLSYYPHTHTHVERDRPFQPLTPLFLMSLQKKVPREPSHVLASVKLKMDSFALSRIRDAKENTAPDNEIGGGME